LYLQTPKLKKSPEARGLSQTMRDPARKKRNASQKTKDRCNLPIRQASANGHGGESSSLTESLNGTKANGKRNGSGNPGRPGSGFVLTNPELEESAASDDASGTTAAGGAAPPSAATCAVREACADMAAPRSDAATDEASGTEMNRRPRAPDDLEQKVPAEPVSKNDPAATKKYPPASDEPLAVDAPGFVDEMHARVNLYEVGKDFLESADMKLKQRTWEYLLEMKYGKGATVVMEEPQRIDLELPRPKQ